MSAQSTMTGTRAENSTNVRTWIQRQIVSLTPPELLARVLEPVMFRTRRRAIPDWERAILAKGERADFGGIATWTWGEGPVVLLVHGWNGRGSQLAALVDPLVALGHRVVAFDAPGHGASSGSRASLVDFADATLSVLDAVRPMFGPARAIVAHSMGGAAVTYAMHRRQSEPSTEIERALRSHPLPAERFVFVAPPIDVREFVGHFVRMVDGGPDLERAMRDRIEDKIGVRMADLYAPKLARDLDAPLLVIHDELDREVPIEKGRMLARSWPGAELHETRGLGHTRILKEPAIVRRIVDFVARSQS